MGKIVVIAGSPRKNGNTNLLASAFVERAESLGHEIMHFDVGRMKLQGCRACNACYKTGKPCAFDDDFNQIPPAVLEADAVVFAMPTYWFSIPSNIKAVLDRLYCFLPGGRLEEAKGKKSCPHRLLRRHGRLNHGRRHDRVREVLRASGLGPCWRGARRRRDGAGRCVGHGWSGPSTEAR